MNNKERLLPDICRRIAELKADDRKKKCLNCECYLGLLYYLKKELSNIKDPDCQEMIEDLVRTLDRRKGLEVHECLGCEPCPPGEWSAELIKAKQ